jgi:hypothetical protein
MAYYGSPYDEEDKRSALTQGLLAAGLAALGARKGSEYNAFAQAGLLGLGGYGRSLENATEARDRKAQREMQAQQYAQQQAEWQRAQQQRAQMEGAQRAATLPGTPGMPAQEADSPGGTYMPPTPGTPGGFDRQKYGQLLEQIDPQKGLAYQQSLAKPTKELSKVENLSFQGKPVTVAFYKDGSREVLPFDPAADKQEVWEDIPQPKGAAPGLQWQRSKTTGQLRSVGSQPPVTNINLGGPKYETGVGGFVYPPSADNPTGKVVVPTGMPAKENKPPVEYQVQVAGISNLNSAIGEYLSELKGWNNLNLANPTAVARMGTKYQNMLLQGKEAYKLGVLNGPDKAILEEIVTNPVSVKGAVLSSEALGEQARTLSDLMARNAENIARAHKQPTPDVGRNYGEKQQPAPTGAAAPAQSFDTLPNPKDFKEGAILTDGVTNRKFKKVGGTWKAL